VTITDHTDAIADIRALADFLEAHPDIPPPIVGTRYIMDPREFARAAHALGDDSTLDVRNGYAIVTLRFGTTVELGVQTLISELLGEQKPPPDQTELVRRALATLAPTPSEPPIGEARAGALYHAAEDVDGLAVQTLQHAVGRLTGRDPGDMADRDEAIGRMATMTQAQGDRLAVWIHQARVSADG
jgi:hypothetical protein